MRSRAYHRAQLERRKKAIINRFKANAYGNEFNPLWGRYAKEVQLQWEDAKQVGIYAGTRQVCSGGCCANVPRKYSGVTRQEWCNAMDALDDIIDAGFTPTIFKKFQTRYENPWSWD